MSLVAWLDCSSDGKAADLFQRQKDEVYIKDISRLVNNTVTTKPKVDTVVSGHVYRTVWVNRYIIQ